MTKKREELTMRVMYEPNRFSATHLMDAYEVIAPTIKRVTSNNTITTTKNIVVDSVADKKGETS